MFAIFCIIISFGLFHFACKHTPLYSPARIFTAFWSIQIIIILFFWSNYLIFHYVGILYILSIVLAFDVGYLLTGSIYNANYQINNSICLKRHTYCIYYLMLVFSFISTIYGIYTNGYGLTTLLDLNSFLEMSHQNSVDRYSGEKEGLIQSILRINSCSTPIFGGLLLYKFKQKKRFFSFISLVPQIISGLVQGAKMGIITGIALFIIGIIIGCQLFNKPIVIKFSTILLTFVAFILFLSLMAISMMFRMGRFDFDALVQVFSRAISYILAHLPAFDIWFSSHQESIFSLTMGGKTIYGITNTLGLLERQQGLFDAMTVVSNEGDQTNVYTYFRLLIEDFGVYGSYLYIIIVGSFCRIIYDNFRSYHNLYLNTALLCGIYFFILWSFVTSVFSYLTYVAMIIYVYLLFKCTLRKKQVQLSNPL